MPPAPAWAPPGDGRDFPLRLAFPLPLAADRAPRERPVAEEPGYTVSLVEFRVLDVPGTDGWRATAALFEPSGRDAGEHGVIVGTGHFGQGKSAPESQEIAHRLAALGARVLVVDAPGMEDQDVPGRWLHFERGAHGRAWLAAAGTSAIALEVAQLRAGLDLLADRGSRHLAAVGASGGAVQAWYLALADERVEATVLAAFPPMPHEARPGGCPCDLVPGWPGPDPRVLALGAGRPSLWLSEVPQPRPAGLPREARFVVLEGPHSFTPAMQREALDFLADWMGRRSPSGCRGEALAPAPLLDLAGGPVEGPGIVDLPLPGGPTWDPAPWPEVPFELQCAGTGPAVVVGGGSAADRDALVAHGLRACRVRPPVDELGPEEAIATGRTWADRQGGALRAAAEVVGARAAWGVRAWGLAARASGLPFVVRDPVRTVEEVDPRRDPPWVHVPGAWWGGVDATLAAALAVGDDPEALAGTLADHLGASGD